VWGLREVDVGENSRAEDVGSVAEEASKLFGALRDWAQDSGMDTSAYQEAATSAAAGAAAWVQEVGEHGAAAAEECRWCPVCRVVAVVRGTSPEVRAHLAAAAGSLVQAASGMLDTQVPDRTRPDGGPSSSPDPGEGAGTGDGDDPGSATWEDD
jgi:hypothetical protein